MKNKLKKAGILILTIAIIAGGIIFIFHKQIKAHFIPTVEQFGEIHIEVKNDTSYISSKIIVKNKSFLKIEIDTIKYKITLFNKTYLQSEKFIGVTLDNHEQDTIDFSLKIPYLTLLSDLKTQRKTGDSASYSIDVFLQYATIFGKSEFPITKSAKIKIPQPPELEVVEIKYTKVRMRSILANAQIKISNYNNVTLSIKNMTYSMKISNQGTLKGSYSKVINIKPNGTSFINLPIEISPDNIGKTVFEIIIDKDNYDYTLTLNAILESSDPLKKSFRIDLIKDGKMELKK